MELFGGYKEQNLYGGDGEIRTPVLLTGKYKSSQVLIVNLSRSRNN